MDVRSDCMTVTLLEPYKFPGRIQDKPGVIAAICSFIFDFPRRVQMKCPVHMRILFNKFST